jgi:hypothetical protein
MDISEEYNVSNFRVDKKPSKLLARSRQLSDLVFLLFFFLLQQEIYKFCEILYSPSPYPAF